MKKVGLLRLLTWFTLMGFALVSVQTLAEDVATPESSNASSAETVTATIDEEVELPTDSAAAVLPPAKVPARVVAQIPVIKSVNDKRQYRYLVLSNQLKVLLVSDPLADKAAAALDVNVGHNQNPLDRPGLAHFLEHMLFLGTEKYPEAGEYQAFIKQHDGRYNAYTAAEHTNFFFEIDTAFLEPALDRFAQFFIAPLMDAAYVERERNAVESEYRMRFRDDARRNLDVYRQLMNPQHPLSKFTVGNLETLADAEEAPLRDELLAFYQHHYSASKMALVVQGRESLNDLQTMILSRFGDIENRPVEPLESYPSLFSTDFLPAKVNIKPEKELRQLVFQFPVPASEPFYRIKPYDYLAHLIGHEGEGSIYSLFKQLGWIEALSAGMGLESRQDGLFTITLTLTEKGARAQHQIPIVLFHVIRQIEQRGIRDWRYKELKQMSSLNFLYQEKQPAMDTVGALAPMMHVFEPQDILQGAQVFQQYDEKTIRQALSFLRADNLLLTFIAPELETDQRSAFYQTPFSVAPLVLEDAEVKVSVKKRLSLPVENIFIPNRIGVKSQPLLPLPNDAAHQQDHNLPQRVLATPRMLAWFKQDIQFLIPKSHIYIRLKLPQVVRDAKAAAQAHIFAALVHDQLNEFAYPAELAGLTYRVDATPRGLDVQLNGYSNRQGLLLNKVAESIRKGSFSEDRFNVMKAKLMRSWNNQQKDAPYQVMLAEVPALLVDPYHTDSALADALTPVSYLEFQRFSLLLLRDAMLETLFYGNMYRQEAIKLASLIEHQLLGLRTGRAAPVTRVYQLKTDDKPALYQRSIYHDDAISLLYVQAPTDSAKDAAHMQLLRQLVQPKFFDQLRTQKQLGYVVSVVPMPLKTLEGSVFVVQSPSVDDANVNREIRYFLARNKGKITDEFKANQAALASSLREAPRSLEQQAERFWQSILLGDYQFNRQLVLANEVDEITPESLVDYYQTVLLNNNRRLWLNSDKMSAADYEPIKNLKLYRENQPNIVFP